MSLTPTKRSNLDDEDEASKHNAAIADTVLSPAANAELLNAFNIETGRLKSDMGLSPLPEGIEVGRRASEMSPDKGDELLLPMSPLRSSLVAQEQADLMADWGANENNLLTGLGEEGGDYAQQQELPLLSPPQSVTKPKRNKKPRQTPSALQKSAILMDDLTELSGIQNASLPVPLKNRKAAAKKDLMTLLNQPLGSDHLFADLFNEITLSSPQKRPITPEEQIEQVPVEETQHIMNEDEKDWGVFEEPIRFEEVPEEIIQEPPVIQPSQQESEVQDNDLSFIANEFPFDLSLHIRESKMTRHQAASTFFNVLLGACNNEYRPVQKRPFDQIILENY
jgi:hypothetical protein